MTFDMMMHELQETAAIELTQLQLTLHSRCKAEFILQHMQQATSCIAMQVLHTRSCSGTGMSFVRFLAACYLTFNMDCLTVAKALETLPALPVLHQSTLAPGQNTQYKHICIICQGHMQVARMFCLPVYIYCCKLRDELACIRLPLSWCCSDIAVQLATPGALMHCSE